MTHWFYKHPPSTLFYLTYDTSIRLNMRLWSVPNLLHTHHMLHLHSGLNIAPTTSYQLYSKAICTQHFCKWWPILYIKFEAWNLYIIYIWLCIFDIECHMYQHIAFHKHQSLLIWMIVGLQRCTDELPCWHWWHTFCLHIILFYIQATLNLNICKIKHSHPGTESSI